MADFEPFAGKLQNSSMHHSAIRVSILAQIAMHSSPCACFPKLARILLYSRHLCRSHLWHHALQEATAKIDEYARGMISGSGSTLFEELGLYYIGPIDGHNMDDLVAVLEGEGDMSRCRCVRRLACCQAEG